MEIGLVGLALVSGLFGIEELDVGQAVFLQVAVLDRRQYVLHAIEIDTGDREGVESALGREPSPDVGVGHLSAVAVFHDRAEEGVEVLHVGLGRSYPHLDEILGDGFTLQDDGIHHPPHVLGRSVIRCELDRARYSFDFGSDNVADRTGDEGEADDPLRVCRGVVDRVHATHRVAGQVETVQTERRGELVNEIDVAV